MLDYMFCVLLSDVSLMDVCPLDGSVALSIKSINDITFNMMVLKCFLITAPNRYSIFLWIFMEPQR